MAPDYPFAVSGRSKNPDAAAAYIDFITNSDAMKVLPEHGNLPVVEADKQAVTGLAKDAFTAWQTASNSTQLVPYLGYATPSAYDTVTGAIEQVLAKRVHRRGVSDGAAGQPGQGPWRSLNRGALATSGGCRTTR